MRLMTFSTYSIDGLYGGPIRLRAIHQVLNKNSWTTHHLCLSHSGQESQVSDQTDIPLSLDYLLALRNSSGRPDVDASAFITSNSERFAYFSKVIDEFNPDVLFLEQPWLWPAVEQYVKSKSNFSGTIVYGSQNIEEQLLESILSGSEFPGKGELIDRCRAIERELSCTADLIVAVSMTDAEHFRKSGRRVVLASNGVWPRAKSGGFGYCSKELKQTASMLFVGSAHPPNAKGFADLLGPTMSYLSPTEKIIVIGGVSKLLFQDEGSAQHTSVNLSRTMTLGLQDEHSLSTFIELCHGIILPITVGAGTNLKTAEALYNRVPIVGTSVAFRGYEQYISFPGVSIADNPEDFKCAVLSVLRSPKYSISYSFDERMLLNKLVWSYTLRDLSDCIRAACEEKQSSGSFMRDRRPLQYENLSLLEDDYFVCGWHPVESSIVWSSDNIGIVRLPRPSNSGSIWVEFCIGGVKVSGYENNVIVYGHNTMLANFNLTADVRKKVVVLHFYPEEIPSEEYIEIYIQCSSVVNLFKMGITSDRRSLGVQLSNLKMNVNVSVIPDQIVRRVQNCFYVNLLKPAATSEGWVIARQRQVENALYFDRVDLIEWNKSIEKFLEKVYFAILGRPVDGGAKKKFSELIGPSFEQRKEFLFKVLQSDEALKIGRFLVIELRMDGKETNNLFGFRNSDSHFVIQS